MKLKNKVIVLTGGTSGIGLELVRMLSETNSIIVIGRSSEKLAALQKQYSNVVPYKADLSVCAETKNLGIQIRQEHASIDLLINNAAVQYTPTFLDADFSYDTIEKEINLNLQSVCALSYLLLPSLMNVQSGAILNINSALGLYPKTGSAVYCATKGGINILTQSLAYQLENTNVSVMQAFLPLVDTPMTEGRGAGKISPATAAAELIAGIENGRSEINIGKVKLLRIIGRLFPSLARQILKRG